jgi:hypothetical protein
MIFMKKLIAIAVVFVLAVGAAFAQISVGGSVMQTVVPIKGSSTEGSDVLAAGSSTHVRLFASGENEDGNFGAWIRLNGSWGVEPQFYGKVWWKPLDIFKFTIGVNPDGEFDGVDGVARWGFYQVACDLNVAKEFWKFSESFFGGFGSFGALLTLTPIEPLTINLGIPFGFGYDLNFWDWDTMASPRDDGTLAEEVYKQIVGQVVYNISDIGKVALTYRGGLNTKGSNQWDVDASKLFAYFGLTAIENLAIDLGVGYYLPVNIRDADGAKTDNIYSAPVALGLSVKFTTGALGIKARVQGQFGENSKTAAGDVTKGNTVVVADLMPYFAINDKVTAHLSTGIDMTKPDAGESTIGWHIEPYVTVKANAWAPNFYAGIRFDSEGVNHADPTAKAPIYWTVPIGINLEF